MSARYIDACNITLKLFDSADLKLLHSIAVKNKVDAVTFYIDSSDMLVAFESYLTNSIVVHKLKCTIKNITITDMNNIRHDVEIDNNKYNNDFHVSQNNNELYSRMESIIHNIDKKTFIRFAATTNILKALAIFNNQEVTMKVDESVQISEGVTKLTISKPRTFSEIEDYLTPFINKIWEKLDIIGVNEISKALLKTKDAIYKMYVAIEDNKIYSHNMSFLIERHSDTVKKKYILPYTTIDVLKTLPTRTNTLISKDDEVLAIQSANTCISWNLGSSAQIEETSNLLSLLNKDNFIRVATVGRSEWDKVSVLKDYSDVDSDQDVNILINNSSMFATKGDNVTTLRADVAGNDMTFKVGIDSLLIARDLTGKNQIVYIDKTGKDSVLVFYNEILVVIAIAELKINLIEQYPRVLSKTIESVQNRNRKKELEKIDMGNVVISTQSIDDSTDYLFQSNNDVDLETFSDMFNNDLNILDDSISDRDKADIPSLSSELAAVPISSSSSSDDDGLPKLNAQMFSIPSVPGDI